VKVHFLPEQVLDLHHSRSLAAGFGAGVAGLTLRELAVLSLYAEGHTLKEIAHLWSANLSGLYQKARSILQRLEVDTLEEAVGLARPRIDAEHEQLPLNVKTHQKEWAPWRPSQLDRLAQVLEGHVRKLAGRAIAAELGVSYTTVRNLEWKARKLYRVESIVEAAECYRKLKTRGEDPFAALEDPELQKQLRLTWSGADTTNAA
jgi:DNA-binding CsgD family transcriptional regulator